MSNDLNEAADMETLKTKYESALYKVVNMRRTYPRSCATLLSKALHKDAEMMMEAEIVPNEKVNNSYSPLYTEKAKIEKLGLTASVDFFVNEGKEISEQIIDIRIVLNQIRASRHKNVQE